MTAVPRRRGEDAERRWPRDSGGRDGVVCLQAEDIQERRGHQELERQEGAPDPSDGARPCNTVVSDLWPQGRESVNPGCLSRPLCDALLRAQGTWTPTCTCQWVMKDPRHLCRLCFPESPPRTATGLRQTGWRPPASKCLSPAGTTWQPPQQPCHLSNPEMLDSFISFKERMSEPSV